MWGCNKLSFFSAVIIRVTSTASFIQSKKASHGVRGEDHPLGEDVAPLCCLECSFLSSEGAWKEGRGSTGPSLCSRPTSPTSFTHSPPMAGPHDPILSLGHLLLLYTLPPSQSHKSWRKCLHPLTSARASSVSILTLPLMGPLCHGSISFPSLCSPPPAPVSLHT